MEREDGSLAETEAFDLDHLARYRIGTELLEQQKKGKDPADYFRVKKAGGDLPHGTPGKCRYEDISKSMAVFFEKIRPLISDPLSPLTVDHEIGDFRITGTIDGLYPDHLAHYRFATIKENDIIRAWVHHLVLNAFFFKIPGIG